MKKIIFLFSIIAFAFIAFSCQDDYTRKAEGTINPAAPALAAPGTDTVKINTLDSVLADTFLIRMNWTKARFTYASGLPYDISDLQYTLEVDINADFPAPKTVTTTGLLYADLYAAQIDGWITGFYPADKPENAGLVFRIKTTDSNGEPLYSNIVTLNVQYINVITPPPPPPPPVNDVMIQWKQVTGSWTDFAVYSWGGSPNVEAFGNWPGKLVLPDADGWYAAVVPPVRPINLILNNNNNGKQFDFLSDPTESASYEINTDNGTSVKVANPAKAITIRWKYIGTTWTASAIYAWGGSPTGETFGGWPGASVTPDVNGWCSVTVPAGQTVGNVIFNNNNNGSQFDVKLNIISSVSFEIDDTGYTSATCP